MDVEEGRAKIREGLAETLFTQWWPIPWVNADDESKEEWRLNADAILKYLSEQGGGDKN